MNIIVDDKSNTNAEECFKKLRMWQRERFGYQTGEWQYLPIKPRILCEKYYGNEDGSLPVDYKLFCCNGKVVCTLLCLERKEGLKLLFMDNNWQRLHIEREKPSMDSYVPPKPEGFSEMIAYAERLSKPFPFVRVDFYQVKDKVILSELTFTPAFNCMSFISDDGQLYLGNLLNIEIK